MPSSTALTPAALDAFLTELASLCDQHGIVLGSRDEIVAHRDTARESVRDRRRFTSTDVEDGDYTEFDASLYVEVSAGTLFADRVRRDTGLMPHHFCAH